MTSDSRDDPGNGSGRNAGSEPHPQLAAAERWLPVVGIAAYALVALVFWAGDRWQPEWDSAIYLLTGTSLRAGEGYLYLGEPFFLRPPGLSFVLSLFSDAGSYDFATLNRLIMASAVATVAALAVALAPTLGRPRACAVALLTGISPIFVAAFDFVLSDLPFLALLFPALALLDRSARGGATATRDALLGTLLLAAAAYLRTAAIVALPGVVALYALRRRGGERWLGLAPAAGVATLIAPWLVHAREAARRAVQPSEQLLLFDYTTALFHLDPGDPTSAWLGVAQWLERIATNSAAIGHDLGVGLLGSGAWPAVAVLCIGLVLGVWAAARRGPDAIDGFAVAYLALLLVYFTHHSRLVLPLIPIAIRALFEGVALVVELATPSHDTGGAPYRVPRRAAPAVLAVALAAVYLGALPRGLDAGSRLLPFGRQEAIWRDLETAAGWLAARTEPDARVLAGPAPSLSLLSGRRVYTWRFARAPRLIERTGARYAVVFPWTPDRVAGPWRARAGAIQRIRSSARPDQPIELIDFTPAGGQ